MLDLHDIMGRGNSSLGRLNACNFFGLVIRRHSECSQATCKHWQIKHSNICAVDAAAGVSDDAGVGIAAEPLTLSS